MAGHRRLMWLLTVFVLLAPLGASAGKHLLAIAAHRGNAAEIPLRFAGRDARRVQRVFQDVGGVRATDSVLLQDPSLDEVHQALEALSRGRVRPGDTLVVYISAHMDNQSVHLGPERLTFEELFASALATGASLRVFILDGCQSGSVTRKGVRRVGPARILRPRPRPARGEVVLTSTAPEEDALESERLAGSFFTHFMVTGLRGVADSDGDGRVSVEELVRFAHDSTVYATAGSPTGSQHPSFKLDLAGSGAAILSEPGSPSGRGARLRVSRPTKGVAYLLNATTRQLEAEIFMDRPGVLVVPPGDYSIRVASAQKVYEGHLTLENATTTELDSIELEEIPLLTLLRKGEGSAGSRWMLRLELEGGVGDSYGYQAFLGGRVAASMEWRSVSLSFGLSYQSVGVEDQEDIGLILDHALGLGVEMTHSLELGPVDLAFGLGLRGIVYLGEYEPMGMDERSGEMEWLIAVGLEPVVRLEVPLGSRWQVAFSLREAVVFFPDVVKDVHFAFSAALGFGWVF